MENPNPGWTLASERVCPQPWDPELGLPTQLPLGGDLGWKAGNRKGARGDRAERSRAEAGGVLLLTLALEGGPSFGPTWMTRTGCRPCTLRPLEATAQSPAPLPALGEQEATAHAGIRAHPASNAWEW